MNIVQKIKNEFPEFVNSEFYSNNEDLPYVFIPFFGDYLVNQIDGGNEDNVKKIIDFIDRNYNSGSPEDQNQIWIGVFEVVGDNKKIAKILNSNLTNDTLRDFGKFQRHETNP